MLIMTIRLFLNAFFSSQPQLHILSFFHTIKLFTVCNSEETQQDFWGRERKKISGNFLKHTGYNSKNNYPWINPPQREDEKEEKNKNPKKKNLQGKINLLSGSLWVSHK